ncbi:hypothetical protein [Thalassococcus profundi]|uniref:hypothetical protein n=1 Tax=Thalassococcus profundi TaxID=2282382 RepID=UPI001F1EE61E|nr:hypothetical protein [Thalassococcus profundi]
MKLDVQGRDVVQGAYRIETDAGRVLVPECLMEGLRPGERPSHQEAYEWIAAHSRQICRAIETLTAGRPPRPPYDLITLLHLAE